MLSKRILLVVVLALCVNWSFASSHAIQQGELLREEFHQTYPLAPQGRVSLGNINGAVRVTGWDRNEVKVDAVKMAYRRDRLDEAKIVVRSDPNSIHIETDYPHRTQSFTTGEGRINNPATVEYTLTVPRNARIDSIELINGHLDIESLTGDVKASSINGRVMGRELMGEVKLSTINGRLEAVFSRLDAAKGISLTSINGPVTLTIPSDSNAELKASSVHGGISNEFGLPVRRGGYYGRDLAGQLGQGGARIKLGNINGMISIKHAQDGRPLSRATNLLAEKVKSKEKGENDDDGDEDFDLDGAKAEARRAALEAARQARNARAEARRAQLEAQRAQAEAQRAQQQALVEAQRAQQEARRAQLEAQRAQAENARAARAAQVDAQRAQIEAQKVQRQVQVEAARAQAEAARAAQDAQRAVQREAVRIRTEAQRAAREASRAIPPDTGVGNTLRLVERESKVFNVSGTPRLNVQTFDGYITVHGWDKQEVQMTISKRAASEEHLRGIRLRSDQNGSSINVIAEFDPNSATRDARLTYPNAVVNLEIYVPRSSAVRLVSGDGRLELDGVNGNLELNTGDGRIEVRDAKGRLTATTGDGRIQVENFDGDVQARTGDGRIILDGRFAQLAARTGSGSILLSLPSDFNATLETDAESVDNQGLDLTEESSSSRRLKRWKIGRGGRVLSLKTSEGRIFLRRAGGQ